MVWIFPVLLLSFSCATLRPVSRGTHPATQTLLNASKAELVKRVDEFYESIRSFDAEVELAPSTGSVYKGTIKDYSTSFTGYLAYRAPAEISVVALVPVVRTTAVKGVSDGKTFRVYLPTKNRFVQGSNDAPAEPNKHFENMRPQDFLSAMLVRPIAATDLTTRIDDINEKNAFYQLGVIKVVSATDARVERRITFDRVNLQIVEQREYNADGELVSDAQYSNWQIFDNIRFPARVEWSRPQEDFGVTIAITKMTVNKPVPDARFELTRPEGTELQVIGGPK